MGIRRLLRSDWKRYCDRISRGIAGGQMAEFEVVSLTGGDHIEARWMPIHGLVYEPKNDVLELALEGVDHLVAHPNEFLLETSARGVVRIEIVADDGYRRIIKLLQPLRLRSRRRRGENLSQQVQH